MKRKKQQEIRERKDRRKCKRNLLQINTANRSIKTEKGTDGKKRRERDLEDEKD